MAGLGFGEFARCWDDCRLVFSYISRKLMVKQCAKRWLACAYLIIIPIILLNLVNKTSVEIIDIWHGQVSY